MESSPQKKWPVFQNLISLKPLTNNQLITTFSHYRSCSRVEQADASNQTLNPLSSQQINLRSSIESAQD